jgi:predicted nucleic acid-binding protein
MIVVSDTSPVRALHHVKLLDLLRVGYGSVILPPSVARELLEPPTGFISIRVEDYAFLHVRSPADAARAQGFRQMLDPGESDALALAIELHADYLLMDERSARQEARRYGIQTLGVLGILLRAKEDGQITRIKPLLDDLQGSLRFFVSPSLCQSVLRRAGE